MSDSFVTQTLSFNKPGPANTTALLGHAAGRAKELGIKKIVIASITGRTGNEALKFFPADDYSLIVVTSVFGASEPDVQSLDPETRRELCRKGVTIVTAAHAFGSVGRGVKNKLGTVQVDEIMAFTLRLLGQGLKVCVEISLMAADQGLVRTDEDIIAIGGTGRGADTACVIKPSTSAQCLELKVREIMAKPWRP